jgi:hypothetical protein
MTTSAPRQSPLPILLDAITPRWLTDRLGGQYPGISIDGIDVVEVVHGTTTKVRVRLSGNVEEHGIPADACIKSNLEPHAPQTLTDGLYDNEARFYRDMRPLIPVPAPAGYYAEADDASGQGFILMEDVKLAGAVFG